MMVGGNNPRRYRTVDDVATGCPSSAILGEELFHRIAVVAEGAELEDDLLAHPKPHDHIEQNGANRPQHERVSDDGLEHGRSEHECIVIDVGHHRHRK